MVWTTYCSVCRSQYPLISTFHAAHRDKDAVVLGIALAQEDERAAVGGYRDTTAQRFPSVVVAPDVMRDAYQHATGGPFSGTPTYLVLDGAGKLRSYIEGPTSATQLEELVARFGSGAQR